MPGEFFTVLFSKNTNKPFSVSFKYSKAKDGDDNVEGGERWPVIARAVRERPVGILAIVGGRSSYGPLGMWPTIERATVAARRRAGRWGGGPLSYGPQGSGPLLFGTRGKATRRQRRGEVLTFF